MPRYLVERTFPDGLAIPVTEEGAQTCLVVVGNNTLEVVTWLHSFGTANKRKMFCICEGPAPRPSSGPPAAIACQWTASPR